MESGPTQERTDATPTLEQIEADIAQLPLVEQVWLMERLAQRIRTRTLQRSPAGDHELAEMAQDSAIQHELQHINAEFAVTEADGLNRAP